jgi:hypothetical protein
VPAVSSRASVFTQGFRAMFQNTWVTNLNNSNCTYNASKITKSIEPHTKIVLWQKCGKHWEKYNFKIHTCETSDNIFINLKICYQEYSVFLARVKISRTIKKIFLYFCPLCWPISKKHWVLLNCLSHSVYTQLFAPTHKHMRIKTQIFLATFSKRELVMLLQKTILNSDYYYYYYYYYYNH